MTTQLPISGGLVALVDDADAILVYPYRWRASRRLASGQIYVMRDVYQDGLHTREYLHRFLLKSGPGVVVDHVNGDRLDNRRANLRECSRSQNNANSRRGRRARSTSPYRGVRRYGKGWRAEISVDRKVKCLGTFTTPEDAAAAYDAAALRHHGEFARTNFGGAHAQA